MGSRFVVHRHKTGKSHLDLRLNFGELFRSWSLLREPPFRPGEQRLAIERESLEAEGLERRHYGEEAFGEGAASIWDEGTVQISAPTAKLLLLEFSGKRLTGSYELKRMSWYPGNRWLLKKVR